MLRRFRSTHAVRTALTLAAVLSLGGSVGLHAEPVSQPESRPVSAAGPSVSTGGIPGAHTCLFCTLYGSAYPSWGAFLAQGVLPSLSGVPVRGQCRPAPPASPCHDGRAPPSSI